MISSVARGAGLFDDVRRVADYEASTYGDRIAAVYDQLRFPVTRFTNATVEFLASVAGKRRVLELGIGTGRIALPLRPKA